MNFFREAFSERNGKASSHRMLTLLIVLDIMGVWTAVSLQKGSLQVLDATLATIVLGALGIGAYRRGRENSNQPKEPNEKAHE